MCDGWLSAEYRAALKGMTQGRLPAEDRALLRPLSQRGLSAEDWAALRFVRQMTAEDRAPAETCHADFKAIGWGFLKRLDRTIMFSAHLLLEGRIVDGVKDVGLSMETFMAQWVPRGF